MSVLSRNYITKIFASWLQIILIILLLSQQTLASDVPDFMQFPSVAMDVFYKIFSKTKQSWQKVYIAKREALEKGHDFSLPESEYADVLPLFCEEHNITIPIGKHYIRSKMTLVEVEKQLRFYDEVLQELLKSREIKRKKEDEQAQRDILQMNSKEAIRLKRSIGILLKIREATGDMEVKIILEKEHNELLQFLKKHYGMNLGDVMNLSLSALEGIRSVMDAAVEGKMSLEE